MTCDGDNERGGDGRAMPGWSSTKKQSTHLF